MPFKSFYKLRLGESTTCQDRRVIRVPSRSHRYKRFRFERRNDSGFFEPYKSIVYDVYLGNWENVVDNPAK